MSGPARDNTALVSPLEVDTDEDVSGGADSTFGDGASYMMSLSESTTHYKYENGRRYHSYREGYYPLPNDLEEVHREEIKHHITALQTGGRTHLAPIGPNPTHILDLGTGIGSWAMDIADEFPSAKIIGTDLSPIQPTWTPSNVSFEVDDAESDWIYPSNIFDLIHVRYMFVSIKNWERMLQQAMRVLKPGGYIELVEIDLLPTSDDNSLPPDYVIKRLFTVLTESAAILGFNFNIAPQFASLLRSGGYTNIVESKFQLPFGAWPRDKRMKEIGMLSREQLVSGLEAISMGTLTRAMGWTAEEVDDFLAGVKTDIRNSSRSHAYWYTYYVYGQKPLT